MSERYSRAKSQRCVVRKSAHFSCTLRWWDDVYIKVRFLPFMGRLADGAPTELFVGCLSFARAQFQ